jgi:indolepyruvate ferredoxin oxidoreductase, beta subunit
MNAARPICVLIGALGGQGGGVLTDWLVEAARLAGFPAQATSIPGVAQRTGATTYYFELFPQRAAPAEPVFSPYPGAGDVDLLVALEPTEAGRALERGYVTGQTTVVSSVTRIYSTAEKIVAGDGVVPVAAILAALSRTAKCLVAVDPAVAPGSHINALIFGAILGSGVLPLTAADGQAAIKSKGLAVAATLAGFEAGRQAAVTGDRTPAIEEAATAQNATAPVHYQPAPAGYDEALADYPASLQPLLGHALARLLDYQDEAYARRFLSRLQPVLAADRHAADHHTGSQASSFRLTTEVARRLAAWMAYEDVFRVAQLKTRPGRLARIRREMGAHPAEPVAVIDYLSPSRHELLNVLPPSLARLLPAKAGFALSLSWPTSSPPGYALLKLLAALKRLRPYSHTFATEQAAMQKWLDAVIAAAAVDYELACQVAELAAWARGYGDVRAAGLAHLQELFSGWSGRLETDLGPVRSAVTSLRFALRHDPDVSCQSGPQRLR